MSACKHKVSGTLSLPSRGAFHLSLTVLLLYRSSGTILAWRVVPPASHGIPRAPRYSGSSPSQLRFRLHGSHILWQAFPDLSPSKLDLPDCPQPQAYCYTWFGLFRFRSPLLSESRLMSFPRATEMFQFTRFASITYVFS